MGGVAANEFIGFLGTLDSASMKAMTQDAGAEVIDAMRRLIDDVTGRNVNLSSAVETSSNELGKHNSRF